MDQQTLSMLPDLQPEELILIQNLIREMTDDQKQNFYALYQGKRKDQQTLLLLTLLGFLGIAGIQRFVIGETGLGIIYLFTLGFCGVGTIIDLVSIKRITSNYNQQQAMEAASMVKLLLKK